MKRPTATHANNLKQIGLGLHNFHDEHKKFPSTGEGTKFVASGVAVTSFSQFTQPAYPVIGGWASSTPVLAPGTHFDAPPLEASGAKWTSGPRWRAPAIRPTADTRRCSGFCRTSSSKNSMTQSTRVTSTTTRPNRVPVCRSTDTLAAGHSDLPLPDQSVAAEVWVG